MNRILFSALLVFAVIAAAGQNSTEGKTATAAAASNVSKDPQANEKFLRQQLYADRHLMNVLRDCEGRIPFSRKVTDQSGIEFTEAQKVLASGVHANLSSTESWIRLNNNDGFFFIFPGDRAFFAPPTTTTFQYAGTLNAGQERTLSHYCQFNNKQVFIANLNSVITANSDSEAFEKLTELAEKSCLEQLALQDKIRTAVKNNQPPPVPKDVTISVDTGMTLHHGSVDKEPCYIIVEKYNYSNATDNIATTKRYYYQKSNYLLRRIEGVNSKGALVVQKDYTDYNFDVEDSFFDTPNLPVEAFQSSQEAMAAQQAYAPEYRKAKAKNTPAARRLTSSKIKQELTLNMTSWLPFAVGTIGILALIGGVIIQSLNKWRR